MKRTEELKQQIAATKETNEMLKMQIITLPKEIETAKENLQTMHQWEYQTKLIRKQSEVALESTKSAYSTLAAICSSIKQMDGLLTADCDASIQGIEAFAKKLLELGSNKIEKEKKFNRLMSNSDDGDIEIDTNREIGSSDGGYYNNGAGYNNGPNSYSTSTDSDSVIISSSDSSTTSSRFSGRKRRKSRKTLKSKRMSTLPKAPSASSSSVQAATANDAALMDKIGRESSSIGVWTGGQDPREFIETVVNNNNNRARSASHSPSRRHRPSLKLTEKKSNIKPERQSNRSQEGSSGNKHKDKENFIDLTLNKDQES